MTKEKYSSFYSKISLKTSNEIVNKIIDRVITRKEGTLTFTNNTHNVKSAKKVETFIYKLL